MYSNANESCCSEIKFGVRWRTIKRTKRIRGVTTSQTNVKPSVAKVIRIGRLITERINQCGVWSTITTVGQYRDMSPRYAHVPELHGKRERERKVETHIKDSPSRKWVQIEKQTGTVSCRGSSDRRPHCSNQQCSPIRSPANAVEFVMRVKEVLRTEDLTRCHFMNVRHC